MIYSTGALPEGVGVDDFNNDTQLDIVVANYGDNSVSILLGYGNGSFANQMKYSAGSGPSAVAIDDFNNDNKLDIVVTNWKANTMSILLGYGNGVFEKPMIYSTGSSPSSVAVGDFNMDTQLDIVVANLNEKSVSVYLGYPKEGFLNQMRLISSNGSRPKSFAIGDFNKDGQMDIAVANSGTNNIGIFLRYDNGSFANQITYSTDSSPWSIAIGDFNNDVILDIVVANRDSDNVGVFLGYSNGSFSGQKMFTTGFNSQPNMIAVGDFNNDTLLDIIVANYGTNNIGVLLGYGNGSFANVKLFRSSYGSHPFSISVGDLDSDGKLDFVVANEGAENLNTFLQTC
ncbi:unnamed protein product [Rotaria sp. Silwood1]|nr:unnamed protein product [Rotaria sp. Silwood1]CAF3706793.1 unnamed protein product [Rotaria sp. Silwood1]CAF3771994.1 unnamed protein product [Rotaria sp. Silwood1]CAF4626892.1 unnamed protein product [Rotaria sp. Silwood1]CAF4650845.1 unnamed protein product [Rotaria sp. Silwood1]